MPTQAQIDANRSNSQASTGPRTEEGKAASRANALDHGLASDTVTVGASESWDEIYDEFCHEFGNDIPSKRVLIEKMTNAIVRERSCDAIEEYLSEFAATEDSGLPLPTPEPGNQATAFSFFKRMGLEKALQLVHRYRTTAMRQFKQSLDTLLRIVLIDRRIAKENAQDRRQAVQDYLNAPLPDIDLSRYTIRTKPTTPASTTEIKR